MSDDNFTSYYEKTKEFLGILNQGTKLRVKDGLDGCLIYGVSQLNDFFNIDNVNIENIDNFIEECNTEIRVANTYKFIDSLTLSDNYIICNGL